MNLYYL